ncbi:divalent metal cation transporter [soil metagenome]
MPEPVKTPAKTDSKVSSTLRDLISSLGPGIITAALVFGPGSLTITSRLGALYGYQLLWVLVISTFFMIVFTGMAARIGMVTNQSLLSTIKIKWGKAASVLTGLGVFLVTASFQAGNSIGAGLAFAELFQTSTTIWIIVFTLGGISLLFFKSFYKVLEKVMFYLVGLMLISFITTLIIVKPSFLNILQGLIPEIPEGSILLVIALVASSFSVVGAFYQSYLVQEKGWKESDVTKGRRESYTGIIILGLISSMILISAATILQPQGIAVNAATDMGKALEPLFGTWATTVFMLGLFGASFSSLIGNATIGGSMLADSFSLGSNLRDKSVRLMIMLVMAIGATVAILFGRLPLELIVFAQGVTIFIVPFIGWAIFSIANDEKIMGNRRIKGWVKITGALGLIILIILAVNNIRIFIF